MLRALVTGASGFVGSALVHELHKQGWQVDILVRPTASLTDIAGLPLGVHLGDIVDPASVQSSISPGTDAVFHVAASTSVWSRRNQDQQQINVNGTHNVLNAAVKAQSRRFIHTSSFTTWGFQDRVLTEDSERTAATDWINYVRTKYVAEQYVLDAAQTGRMDAVILNPGHILGPGDRHNWSRMFTLLNAGKLPGVPPGSGPFADVRQVAKAHIEAFHRGRNGEKYLLGGESVSFLELIRIAGEVLGKPVPKKPTPAWLLKFVAHLYELGSRVTGNEPDLTPESALMISSRLECDSSRAQRELDYSITPIKTLVQDSVDWMKISGMLNSRVSKS